PPAADPPTRARPRPPVARRAWGFAIGPAPRSTVIGDVPVRPRTLAAAVIVACLIAIGAIGLAEGGARRSGPRRQANANVVGTGSSTAWQLEPATGYRPLAESLRSARIMTLAQGKETRAKVRAEATARAQAEARARVRDHQLARQRAARKRHDASRQHHITTASSSPSVSPTVTSPTETTAPPTVPTSSTPTPT